MSLYFEHKAQIAIIYRSAFFHTALWSWVCAKREEGKTIAEGLESFINFWGLDDYMPRDLYRVFDRKNKEWRQSRTMDTARSDIVVDSGLDEHAKQLIAEHVRQELIKQVNNNRNGKNGKTTRGSM